MKRQLTFLFLFVFLNSFAQKKVLDFADRNYEPNIKTVQLYPFGPSVQTTFEPAVVSMNSSKKLVLEFDDLKDDADYYYVYFIHCNANWTPSSLRPNMYINGYNEFEITDFEFSTEARINYVHYRYEVPKFKVSGNYLMVVYRNQKKDDIVLSRRFSIYENKIGLGARVDRSSNVSDRRTHQRIEATVNYGDLNAIDPRAQFNMVVRQNERPDMARPIFPTYIDENVSLLKYQNLDDNNEFAGGNEFRLFDLSTVNFGGRNVANTEFVNDRPHTKLRTDRQADVGYLINLDLNGKFYVRDLEGRNSTLSSEYVDIQFTLDYPKTNQNIYLVGAFNNWQRNEESRLVYNPATNLYQKNVLLKQGWYDYRYVVEGNEPNEIDRSFFETENLYEVFVYFRPMGARGDLLVGYYKLEFNRRR